MNIELSFRNAPGYLFVEVAGDWRAENAKHALDAIRAEADKQGQTRVLLDARKLLKPDTEMTRFFTGEHFAAVLGPPFKTAVIAKPEIYNKFAETVAKNRGATLAVFFEEPEALQWLGV